MHEPLGGNGQPLDPVRNRLADGLRHAGRATVVEASAELDDEERVPVARRPHCIEVAPMSRPEQTRHRRLFQAVQVDFQRRHVAAELDQPLDERPILAEVRVAVRADDHDRRTGLASQRMAKDGQRGLVRPLQVVEHDERRAITRETSENRRHRLEDHEPLTGRLAVHGDSIPQLRQDEHEIRCDIAGKRGDLAAGEPVDRAAERLRERLVRPQRLLVAPPVEHERAGVGDELGQSTRQAGLAHAGLAADEGHRGPTTGRRRPGIAQRRQLALAAHQFGVAVEPQRRGHRRRGTAA